MAILEKEVWIGLGAKAKKHFEKLGYEIPEVKDKWGNVAVPKGTKILVRVEDLPINSNVLVTKICDYCPDDNKYMISVKYSDVMNKRVDNKDRCLQCSITFRVKSRMKNVKYENSIEYYCKENNIPQITHLFSSKNNRKISEISYGSKYKYIWNCSQFGEYHEHEMIVKDKLKSPSGCPYCSNQKVLIGYNDMWTTHPNVAKLLWDNSEGYLYTGMSSQKLHFKCPDCNFKLVNRIISNITKQGLSCPRCSDGVSYPEKFMTSMLSQLNISYELQKGFIWLEDRKYDFYLEDYDCIIETHGAQHYEANSSFKNSRTLKEEIENDLIKKDIAISNGIKNYITINCSKSDAVFIKRNIMDSEISKIFNLHNIDWDNCHENACKSIIHTVCEIWNSGQNNTLDIARLVKRSRGAVINYLKIAAGLNLCSYDPKEEITKGRIKNDGNNGRAVVRLSITGVYIDEYKRMAEAEKSLGINSKLIWNVCNNKYQTAGGYRWMYKEEYEKQIQEDNHGTTLIKRKN